MGESLLIPRIVPPAKRAAALIASIVSPIATFRGHFRRFNRRPPQSYIGSSPVHHERLATNRSDKPPESIAGRILACFRHMLAVGNQLRKLQPIATKDWIHNRQSQIKR